MVVKVLQGWHSDPFELHGERYFSAAGQPTKLVRDGYRESYDEPPADPGEVADAMARFMAKPEAARPGDGPPGDAYQDHLPGGAASRQRRPAIVRFTAAGVITSAAAVATLVLVALPALRHPSKPASAPGMTDVALVKLAAEQTMRQRTAHTAMSASFTIAGKTSAMEGTSAFDIGGKAGTTDFTMNIPSVGVMTERVIQVNKIAYVSTNISGQKNFMPVGKTWISEPFSVNGSNDADPFSGDAISTLATLEKQGLTVQNLGTKVIEGVYCTGYSVTPPSSAGTSGTIAVWIDSQHLVREFTMNVAPDNMLNGVSTGASSTGATSSTGGTSISIPLSMDMTMDFSYSALPLHVTAPPAASTIPRDEFLNQLGQGAKSPS